MLASRDAAIALAGVRFEENASHDLVAGPDSIQRAEVAAQLVLSGSVENLIIAGGFPSTGRKRTPNTLAHQMRAHVLEMGVHEDKVKIDPKSIDTIGNLIEAKKLAKAEGWHDFYLVTSTSHMERAMDTAGRVFGPAYTFAPVEAGESPYKKQAVNEHLGRIALGVIARGVVPGDDETLEKRLLGILPGYQDMPVTRRIWNLAGTFLPQKNNKYG